MDELDAAVAREVEATLDAGGMRREDFAREMAALGFSWTANTVSQVINGRRGLSLLELAGVCEVLQRPVGKLVDAQAGRQLELPSGSVSATDVSAALMKGRSAWRQHRRGELTPDDEALYQQLFPAEYDEAASKAARRLGITTAKVHDASIELWGQELGRERDRRVQVDPQESRRSLQARRGHITRVLLDEIRAHLGLLDGEDQ